jgi:hypothetical protein
MRLRRGGAHPAEAKGGAPVAFGQTFETTIFEPDVRAAADILVLPMNFLMRTAELADGRERILSPTRRDC